MESPRRRADAVQNRARIVEAARKLVAGPDEVKLNEVAKAAGVGQGTLYRHFPTREELLIEVYRDDVQSLVTAAHTFLGQRQPLEALTQWLRSVVEYARVKRGVFAAVTSAVRSDLAGHSIGPIADAVTTLLDAGKADGTLRNDVDARDVILLIGYLTRLDEAEWDSRAHHVLAIIVDGLRSRR
jgi:AcrR family transcriptional regulator